MRNRSWACLVIISLDVRVRNVLEIVLGALVVIGLVVFWCDVTDSWNDVFRRIRALLHPYSK